MFLNAQVHWRRVTVGPVPALDDDDRTCDVLAEGILKCDDIDERTITVRNMALHAPAGFVVRRLVWTMETSCGRANGGWERASGQDTYLCAIMTFTHDDDDNDAASRFPACMESTWGADVTLHSSTLLVATPKDTTAAAASFAGCDVHFVDTPLSREIMTCLNALSCLASPPPSPCYRAAVVAHDFTHGGFVATLSSPVVVWDPVVAMLRVDVSLCPLVVLPKHDRCEVLDFIMASPLHFVEMVFRVPCPSRMCLPSPKTRWS